MGTRQGQNRRGLAQLGLGLSGQPDWLAADGRFCLPLRHPACRGPLFWRAGPENRRSQNQSFVHRGLFQGHPLQRTGLPRRMAVFCGTNRCGSDFLHHFPDHGLRQHGVRALRRQHVLHTHGLSRLPGSGSGQRGQTRPGCDCTPEHAWLCHQHCCRHAGQHIWRHRAGRRHVLRGLSARPAPPA